MVMIATDLDGTLLDGRGRLSAKSRAALEELGARGVVRVVATGRSRFSADRVLPGDLPLDYLVVSSGAGIIDFATGQYLRVQSLAAERTAHAAAELQTLELDFMVHERIPDNHRFAFHRARGCADFERRVDKYREHAEPGGAPWALQACQLLAIHEPTRDAYDDVRARLPGLSVVRTTSPLDQRSVWIEIFPGEVSKSQACAWIAARHDIGAAEVTAIGNDTNDLDLLHWAGHAFAVGNAHPQLLDEFRPVATNDGDGFAQAAGELLARI